MYTLKRLTPAGVAAALEKAEQYRLLNQPWAAESICWDITEVEPGNQHAVRIKILAQSDQFGSDSGAPGRARDGLSQLSDPYQRAYYTGLVSERSAKAALERRGPGANHKAYDELRRAMTWYEHAEAIRPAGDDDAILRWNTCARLLNQSPHLAPRADDPRDVVMGE
jgi:hypothetical protein